MKLRNVLFQHEAKSGEEIKFSVPVTVTTDGMFNMMVPKEYREELRNVDGAHYYRGGVRFSATSLIELKGMVDGALEQYLAYKTVEEIVIRYHVRATCHYCEDKKGNVYPNGSVMEDAVGYYNWAKTMGRKYSDSFNSEYDYSVSLMAELSTKRTHTRGKIHRKVEYILMCFGAGEEVLGEFGLLLNGFQKVQLPDDSREMPYTEEAAKFFYLSMMSLCKLDSGVKKFFADEKKVLKAIKSGSMGLLLAGGD